MRHFYKNLLASVLCVVSLTATAQVPTNYANNFLRAQRKAAALTTGTVTSGYDFKQITQWVGSGPDSAALVIAWHDGLRTDTLAWGYRYTSPATGQDMLQAIVQADARLYALVQHSKLGAFITGLGYDLDGSGIPALIGANDRTLHTANGWYEVQENTWMSADSTDHFRNGFVQDRYFSYLISADGASFAASPTGATERLLTNGGWDLWSYAKWDDKYVPTHYTASTQTPQYTQGIFMVNEDWFGHNNSTVNFLSLADTTWHYRVYKGTNPPDELGVTTQYGAIYGNRFYFMSKQDGPTGARFVVAHAGTLQSLHRYKTLPDGGDGRAFAAISPRKAYLTTSKGLVAYDLQADTFLTAKLSLGESGLILPVGRYAFVESVKGGVQAIDTEADTVVCNYAQTFSPTLTRNGQVWVAGKEYLYAINPQTLQLVDSIALAKDQLPTFAKWAWNAGSLFAGNHANTLYWGYASAFQGAQVVYKVDLDAATRTPRAIINLKGEEMPYIYGAAIRLRPADDHIFLQAYKDFAYQNYQLQEYDAQGTKLHTYPLTPNYWFPALPVFPDVVAPTISVSPRTAPLGIGETDTLAIRVQDPDSYLAAITLRMVRNMDNSVLQARTNGHQLIIKGLTEGESTVYLQANANGLMSDVAVRLQVSDPTHITAASVQGSLVVRDGKLYAEGLQGQTLTLLDIQGRTIRQYHVTDEYYTASLPAGSGVYILRSQGIALKFVR